MPNRPTLASHLLVLVLAALVGCSESERGGGDHDAGTDAALADAGTDAGTDAGGPDASGSDASLDAGPLDAGADADPGDAGTGTDAGPVDAGTDSGPLDAGTDAGSPCDAQPCAHGGVCTPNGASFSCSCIPPYQGSTCQLMQACVGSPSACASQSQALCNTVAGCASTQTCFGSPSPCIAFDIEIACLDQPGCAWDGSSGTCGGTPPACAPGSCANGCLQGTSCSGVPTGSCSGYALATCSAVAGCALGVVSAP